MTDLGPGSWLKLPTAPSVTQCSEPDICGTDASTAPSIVAIAPTGIANESLTRYTGLSSSHLLCQHDEDEPLTAPLTESSMRWVRYVFSVVAFGSLLALPTHAAMYKWVDEKGSTHYGDRVPPQYSDRAGAQLKKSGRTVQVEQKAAAPSRQPEQDPEKRMLEAKQQTDRQRQDNALLATYANEAEIDQARGRELRRNSDTLKLASAGLAKSSSREDQNKLGSLIEQNQKETDAINARFDAHKLRFRELTGTGQPTQTTSALPGTKPAPTGK